MSDRSAGSDVGFFFLQSCQSSRLFSKRSVKPLEPESIQITHFLLRSLFSGLYQSRLEAAEFCHGINLSGRQHSLLNSQILQSAGERFTTSSLPDAPRCFGTNRGSIQLVVLDVLFLHRAVDIDLQARSFSAAVIGHSDVHPFIGGNLSLADDLQSFVWPRVDDMHANASLLHPEVPASIAWSGFHASQHGSAAIIGWHVDPRCAGEWLIGFKVTNRCHIAGGTLNLQSFPIGSILPFGRIIQCHFSRIAVQTVVQ